MSQSEHGRGPWITGGIPFLRPTYSLACACGSWRSPPTRFHHEAEAALKYHVSTVDVAHAYTVWVSGKHTHVDLTYDELQTVIRVAEAFNIRGHPIDAAMHIYAGHVEPSVLGTSGRVF